MHLHAFPADFFGKAGLPNPVTGTPSAASTDEALLQASLTALERYNIVKAVTSGPLARVEQWRAAAPDRFIGAPLFPQFAPMPDLEILRSEAHAGRIGALGEMMAQYAGLSPSDPSLEPYFALAEELDLPVGIHTGLGPPGTPYGCCSQLRVTLGNPVLLEEVLLRHPKLRLYIMHGGVPICKRPSPS
jgi:predicted TIM-barrel fold metal-dependent hydrolase